MHYRAGQPRNKAATPKGVNRAGFPGGLLV
jgi:hypothetical protein